MFSELDECNSKFDDLKRKNSELQESYENKRNELFENKQKNTSIIQKYEGEKNKL